MGVKRWHAGLLLSSLGASLLCGATPTQTPQAPDSEYVGSTECKRCHFEQYRSWSHTAMSRAFELLQPGVRPEGKRRVGLDPERDYRTDPGCLRCHAVGDAAGVGCEACHGSAGGPRGYLSVMTLANKRHRIEELTGRGLVYPVPAERCTELCHNASAPHNASADPRYGFSAEERLRKGGGHAHWKLRYDHGPLPTSYFQTLHPELLQETIAP
jgi:cytochrome c554/c'-like protein